MDIEGFGDSPPRAGAPRNDSYSSYATINARAAIDYLKTTRAVENIVLCGMCSGAYHVFHTALADERVNCAIMIRPQVFSWGDGEAIDPDRHSGYREWLHYASRLFEPEAWVKALRGKIAYRRALRAVGSRVVVYASEQRRRLAMRIRGEKTKEAKLFTRFKSILDRGDETLLIYSKHDPGLDHLNRQLGRHMDDLRARKNFRMSLMNGKDYTFAAVWSQDQLFEEITTFVVRRFG
jgi:hypothetical protein